MRRQGVQRQAASAQAPPASPAEAAIREVVSNPGEGRPLDPAVKGEMEKRFSTDFDGVRVHDDGPSIPAHERERVFERFHRLLGTARDGSGLGLAIAREIARIHGAEIVLADDEDGIGNSFRVTFPPPRAPL